MVGVTWDVETEDGVYSKFLEGQKIVFAVSL